MSGFSDITNCPNCDEEMFISEESRPFHAVNGDCPHCGFYYHTQAEQMSLFELNDLREDHDLKPLKQRPIIEGWLKGYLRPSFSENNLFRNAELTNKDTLWFEHKTYSIRIEQSKENDDNLHIYVYDTDNMEQGGDWIDRLIIEKGRI